jgi:hypothetical protein
VEDYLNQPTGGSGKSLASFFTAPGQRIQAQVARAITPNDIRQQTSQTDNIPLKHTDGTPKWVMIVPLNVQPSQAFPDGKASWYVKGQPQAELTRAMAEAGAPAGTPEPGALVDITFTGERPVPNRNAQKQFAIIYTRPDNAPPLPAEGTPPLQQLQQAPQPQYAPQPAMAAPQPQYAPPQQQAPAQPAFEGQGYGQGFGTQPQQGQPQYAPPQQQQAPAQQQQPQYGIATPGQQVAQATQAGVAAAQGAQGYPAGPQAPVQVPQAGPAGAPGQTADQAAMLARLTGAPAPVPQP